jgi:hypothetical protein
VIGYDISEGSCRRSFPFLFYSNDEAKARAERKQSEFQMATVFALWTTYPMDDIYLICLNRWLFLNEHITIHRSNTSLVFS